MTGRIYLDHAATSPLRPEAAEAMAPWLAGRVGNPMSAHAEGRAAQAALAAAREQVAALVGARPEQVVFTSGATEATNLALRGQARAASRPRAATTAVEHPATRQALSRLAAAGWEVRWLAVDGAGRLDPASVSGALGVVSVIAGHNELGTLQPLAAIAEATRRAGARLHLDAVQSAGCQPLADLPWDWLTLSAHKLGGPGGVGALVCRADVRLEPVLVGSSQEGGLRPGTVSVALAAGFGAACAAAAAERGASRLGAMRDALGTAILEAVPGASALGTWRASPAEALPHLLAVGIPGVAGDELVEALDAAGVAASSSSACLSGARSPSLDAIGLSASTALLRLSLGWSTREVDVAEAIRRVPGAIAALRAASPLERRRAIVLRRAEGVVTLEAAHWELAEAVLGFHAAEGVLPGPRALARLGVGAPEALIPGGMAELAAWLGLPVPRGGCRLDGT